MRGRPEPRSRPLRSRHMELFIFSDPDSRAEEWRVEAIDTDGDGSCEVSLFSGPGAEARARAYAAWRHPGATPRARPYEALGASLASSGLMVARAPITSATGPVRGPLPDAQKPQLASLTTDAPSGPEWISEVKFDGYRLLAAIDGGKVRLLTRSGLDWSDRLPAVRAGIAELGLDTAMLDGELVALRADGVSSFPALQAALKAGRDGSLTYYAFDLLYLDRLDLRPCPLLERKRLLASAGRWSGYGALQHPPSRAGGRAIPERLPYGAGGHHLQTG